MGAERQMSKAALKLAEKEAFRERVKEALVAAHAAAEEAFQNFAKTAKRTKDGFIADSCGGAYVIIYKPSYAFRKALEDLGEISRGHEGAWRISNFTKAVAEQSITAAEVAAEAACQVLKVRFPDETNIFAKSYID